MAWKRSFLGKVGATANLDRPCARGRQEMAGRGGETGFQIEQRNCDQESEGCLQESA
jgi:hypothetical protein